MILSQTILLVEDDVSISEMVTQYLENEGYSIHHAFNGSEAEHKLQHHQYDIIILDVMLPEKGGLQLLQDLRQHSVVPVLMMSAKGSDVDKALGLGFGADDYLAKPFSLIELLARVNALIRRYAQYAKQSSQQDEILLSHHGLCINLTNYSVQKNNEQLHLTATEFQLLTLLVKNPKRVYTKEQICQLIWEEGYFGDDNKINVHIRRLRAKIEDDPSNPTIIQTIWGIGYKCGEAT
ncbi:response regulator transcription factor [Longirhabdus pacifica]|uniref:response regulator transcription factor n=1 Tax=Longirhabdus pacifica TaxID=2305227 RepID=UPI0010092A0D|nr:response regulator transcription factor [Longirhabdus pacifica]